MTTELIHEEEGSQEVQSMTTLDVLNRSEIDIAIATAKRYPRSITAAKRDALTLATLDEETAATMFYALPRGGKRIEGPSVRLAEIIGHAWGNIRYGARTVEIGADHVTAQGVCFDLEKNVQASYEVRRRITDKHGRRYNDDMINVTANAANSIALRQAIFKVIPYSLVKSIYEEARQAAIGKALTMEQRRARAFEWYAKLGVSEARVLTLLGHKAVEDVTIDDLVTLTGLKTALTDGETTVEEAFADATPVKEPPAAGSTGDRLAAKLKAASERGGYQPPAEGQPETLTPPPSGTGIRRPKPEPEPKPEPVPAPKIGPKTPRKELMAKLFTVMDAANLKIEMDDKGQQWVTLPKAAIEAIGWKLPDGEEFDAYPLMDMTDEQIVAATDTIAVSRVMSGKREL
jgi:hypothetical protein